MKTTIQSSQIQFSRDGRTVVIAEPDAVTLLEVHGEGRRRIEISAVQAVAACADQMWVATRAGVLIRLAIDGRRLDEHQISPDLEGQLLPATIGGPAALWIGRESFALVDDLGALAVIPHEVDGAIPVAGRRFARYAGPRLTLPAGRLSALSDGARIAGGSVVFDGTALALIAERSHGRDVVVVALASGTVLQTVPLASGLVRIAARRGLVVVHDAARRLALTDLRFGRHLGAVQTDEDVTDVAIDPDGRMLAIRLDSGELELASLGERMGAASRLPRPTRSSAEHAIQESLQNAGPATASTLVSKPTAHSEETATACEPNQPSEVISAMYPNGKMAGSAPRLDVESLAQPLSFTAEAQPARSAPGVARAPFPLPHVVVDALDPRTVLDRLPRAMALAELEREIRLVSLWALRAISIAWDTRRLSYGNEGHHPYEHEVAALVGMNSGYAPAYLATAESALDEHEAALVADPQYRSATTPVAELTAEFGLSPVAVDILLVIAAASLHGDVARLYGILGNDTGRALVDELLVQQVLVNRASRHDIAAELHSQAPLVRLGIVGAKTSKPRPFAPLEVDPVILARLCGEQPVLGTALAARGADRDIDSIELAPMVLASAIKAMAQAASPARIAVRGRAGTGRRTLLAAFAHHAGRALGLIDVAGLPRDPERFREALLLALRRAQLAGLVPAVSGLTDVVLDQRRGVELAHEVLAAHPGPLAVVLPPATTAPLPTGHVVLDVPSLSETERVGVWQRALAGTGQWLRDPAGLAARYRVGPGVIHRAVAALAGHDPMSPSDERVDAFLRQSRDLRLADHARRVERLACWADLVLPSDVMDSLRELVGRVRHRRRVFEDWGMGRTMATSRGLTALFQGQPGTGKTLVAGVIARELGLDLYQVDLSKVMSKWIGETERNLATIFDAAEDGQVILLFDEADSLFAKRTEIRSSNDRYANLEVNYLLQRLDSFEGIAILTTNSGGSIDPAFKRRLSFRLSFPFPDEDTRAELWRAHLPPELPREGDLTFDVLAHKYQLSGGYIRNACMRAAFLAAQEETVLHQHHLERAVALEFAELGKLSTAGSIS